jgi:hypothetical protein
MGIATHLWFGGGRCGRCDGCCSLLSSNLIKKVVSKDTKKKDPRPQTTKPSFEPFFFVWGLLVSTGAGVGGGVGVHIAYLWVNGN